MLPIGPLMIEHRLIGRMVALMKQELARLKDNVRGGGGVCLCGPGLYRHHGRFHQDLRGPHPPRQRGRHPVRGPGRRRMVSSRAALALAYSSGQILPCWRSISNWNNSSFIDSSNCALRSRTGHHHHLARNFRSRRLAGTIDRRIHRKNGPGIIPVDREKLVEPAAYGNDRVFAFLRLSNETNKAQDAAVNALERAGHPVVRIVLST